MMDVCQASSTRKAFGSQRFSCANRSFPRPLFAACSSFCLVFFFFFTAAKQRLERCFHPWPQIRLIIFHLLPSVPAIKWLRQKKTRSRFCFCGTASKHLCCLFRGSGRAGSIISQRKRAFICLESICTF